MRAAENLIQDTSSTQRQNSTPSDSLAPEPGLFFELAELRKQLGAVAESREDASCEDRKGLIRYVRECSDAARARLALKFASEKSAARKLFVDLMRYMVIHSREPGRIQLCAFLAGEFLDHAAHAHARAVLVDWAKEGAAAGDGETSAGPGFRKPPVKVMDDPFRAEAGDSSSGLSYPEQHTSLVYYELYGCLSCHRNEGPHMACGLCGPCYALINQRRRRILEGRKHYRREPPARLGVPSPLRKEEAKSQLAAVAVKAIPLRKEEAKKRQANAAPGVRGGRSLLVAPPEAISANKNAPMKGNARDIAAKSVGVGGNDVCRSTVDGA